MMRALSIGLPDYLNKLAKSFNNALCFSLYLPFVFLTALMTGWLNHSGILTTLLVKTDWKISC